LTHIRVSIGAERIPTRLWVASNLF